MAAAMRKPENRQQQDVVRLPNGQFRPGASGNPGGRPAALSDLRELAREHTPAAVAKLAHIMEKGKSEQACIAAASALLDRGWGKPTQPLSGDKDAPPIGLSIEDQQREISERHERSRRLLDEVFNEIVTTQDAGSAGSAARQDGSPRSA